MSVICAARVGYVGVPQGSVIGLTQFIVSSLCGYTLIYHVLSDQTAHSFRSKMSSL